MLPIQILRMSKPAAGGGGTLPALIRQSVSLSSNGTAQTHTFATAPAIGNTVTIGLCGWDGAAGPDISSVTDNASPPNTYAVLTSSTPADTSRSSIAAGYIANQPTQITVTMSGSCDISWGIAEFSNILSASPLDQVAIPTYTVLPTSPYALNATDTTTQANEVVLTVVGGNASASDAGITAPSGFTLLQAVQINTFINVGFAYKIISTTGAQSASWPFAEWIGEIRAVMLTLKASS